MRGGAGRGKGAGAGARRPRSRRGPPPRAGLAAVLAPAALLVTPLAAQEGDTLRLTIDEALVRAEASSPALRRAANDLALDAPERRATWANQVLPSLRLDLLETGYNGRLTRVNTDFFGNPIENPDAEFAYFSGTRQGLGLTWNVQGPSLLNRLDAHRGTVAERRAGLEAARHALRTRVRRAFFDALAQEALLEAERDLVRARAVDLELAERLFSLTLKTRVDVLNAELEVERQNLAAQRQARALEQARLALRTEIGDAGLPPLEPVAGELPVFDPAGLDADVLVARAVERSPDVVSTEAALGSADVAVAEARESRWPSLHAAFDVGRQVQTRETDALFDLGGFGDHLYSSFRLSLSVPFFNDPFGNRMRTARAEVALDDRREALREARLQADQAVRSALVALHDQWETLAIAERALDIAGRALEMAREEYRLGTRTFETLQTSIEQEGEARRQVVTARYGFLDALVTLEDAVGGPVAPGTPPAAPAR